MEEISLREYIEVLLRGKWIIAIITAVCVLLSAVYAQFIMQPTYEARTSLMVSPFEAKVDEDDNQFSQLVDSLSQYPQMTLDTYKEQIKAPEVLNEVIKDLKLDEKYDMTRSDLSNMVTMDSPKNTNLIYVKVTHSDPELAAQIANVLSQKFVDFFSEKLQEQTGKTAEFIEKQLQAEKQNVEKATNQLKEFLERPRGVDELKQELTSKLVQLTEFKTQLAQVKMDSEIAGAALAKARQELAKTPKTLETQTSVGNDALLSQVIVQKTGKPITDVAGIQMTQEQINPAYTSLLQNISNYEIELSKHTTKLNSLKREIAQRQKEIEQLQAELAEKQNEFEILQHEVELAKQTRDAYQQKLKEANIKQSAEIGRSSIIVVSEALPPIHPTSSKVLVVAIAGVLGVMMSVFVVFFMEYWKNSEGEVQSNERIAQ